MSSHIKENIINFDENNVLIIKMIVTLEIIFITSSKWLESAMKRNQSMNELFIKSFINWRLIKEENSWSIIWKKIHDHMHEDSIIKDFGWSKNLPSLFKIWFGRIEINQMNFYFEQGFSGSYKEHSGHTKWREHPHLMFLKITNIFYIYYLVIY